MIFSRIGLKRQIATTRPWLQLGRSILLLTATAFFFTAVRYLSLAEAISINFVSPLLVTAYAFVVLALFAYVVSLARRLGGVQRDLDRLESDLKRNGRI